MIVGVGTDLVEIERIRKMIERRKVLSRIYTEEELTFSKGNITTLAGNFAVKEAVSKVFGTGFFGIEIYEIEVLRNKAGAPYVVLSGRAQHKAKELGIHRIHVSISNTKEFASVIAIGESI
ncbi:MAG: holo-ACP synthase [Anaerostipes sp.]|nr:holo-ACP synthase [Anaerostipes sp.]